jgi:hypothetical protein
MVQRKRKWSTPQLIVLARGTPEESVLESCKVNNPQGNPYGPNGTQVQNACAYVDTKSNCQNCQSRGMGAS